MDNHWHPAMRRFVFTAMLSLGVTSYSFLGDTIEYQTAQGGTGTTTIKQLKTDMFDKAFDNPQAPTHGMQPKNS